MTTHLNPDRLLSDWPQRQPPEPRETRCAICNADGEGLAYCPDHIEDGFRDKDEEIRCLRHKLAAINQLCERVQDLGSKPQDKRWGYAVAYGRTLALVREIQAHAHWMRGR